MTDQPRPDPFDALRRPDAPIAPREQFQRELLQRLRAELQPLLEPAISAVSTVSRKLTTMTVTPYLIVDNAIAALDFYRDAFGAVETHRLVGDDGRIGHSEFLIGGSKLMMADEYPEIDAVGPNTRGGPTCSFTIEVDGAAAVDATYEHALSLGARSLEPPADQFHGSRSATVADPFGHRWTLSALIEQLTSEEYADRAANSEHGSFALQERSDNDEADRILAEVSDEIIADAAAALVAGSHLDPQAKHHERGDLYYFTLPVDDIDAAQRFYGAVLGWQFNAPGEGHIANIAAPPGGVAVSSEPGARLYFVVDDIHAAVARVRELGGTAEEPVLYASGWMSDCTDDQGTHFSLSVPSSEYSL